MESNETLNQLLDYIGCRLYLIRHEKRQKLSAVAKGIGVSHPVISQIENGRYKGLSFQLLCKIASYYNVGITDLMPIKAGNQQVNTPIWQQ